MQTVIGYVIDGDGAALHKEELLAVDTITHRRENMDGGVLDAEIFAGLDTVFHVTRHVQRTFLRKLCMTLDIETSFLLAVSGIHERVRCTIERFHFDTLAVLDMDCCAGINSRHVRQVEVVQFHGRLVNTFVIEPAVG